MEKWDKKGLSGVIETLIIISLSLLAIVIIWAVVHNIISSSSKEVEIGTYTTNIEISKVSVNGENLDITVKRGAGKGDLNDLKIIISDGTSSQIFEEKDIQLQELESKTFTISYSGAVKKISISPDIGTATGNTAIDEIEYNSVEAIENMPGLVSWWRMEGNAEDEMGRNNGIVNGGSFVDGKFGKGFESNSNGENITVPHSPSLQLEDSNITVLFWIYLYPRTYVGYPDQLFSSALSKGNVTEAVKAGYQLIFIVPGQQIIFGTNKTASAYSTTRTYQYNKWSQMGGSQKYNYPGTNTATSYLDGTLFNKSTVSSSAPVPSTENLLIGEYGYMEFYSTETFINGTIDEVMIFNRTLSDSEIQSLYNLDLNN